MNIVDSINEIKVWHHKIDLGNGVVTPGLQDTPQLLTQINLPANLSGMRVLDLGARDGFFSFECEKRGASEVVALDYVDWELTGFKICHEYLNSRVKFINGNIYSLNKGELGSFDLVLFLGLIYHLRHPVLALDRIYDVMNPGGSIIVESHTIDHGLVGVNGEWTSLNSEYSRLQMAQFYSNGKLGNDVTSPWAPNQLCLEMMAQDSGFRITDSWTAGFRGGITGVKFELAKNHPRWIDTANSLNMHNNLQILKDGEI
jgi:tRNA (mo5U34)-methyltransferase